MFKTYRISYLIATSTFAAFSQLSIGWVNIPRSSRFVQILHVVYCLFLHVLQITDILHTFFGEISAVVTSFLGFGIAIFLFANFPNVFSRRR